MARFTRLLVVLLAVFSGTAVGHEATHGNVTVIHPYTVEMRDGGAHDVPVLMTIENSGSVDDTLVSVSSKIAGSGRLTSSSGTEPMRITIPAGGRVRLVRDGPHVLLSGVKTALTGYTYFPLVLEFEKAGRLKVEVLVEERQ